MKLQTFKDSMAGAQSLVTAFALIAGGIWAWHVFDKELRVENAEKRLELLQFEIDRDALQLDLEIEELPQLPGASRTFVEIRLVAFNPGPRDQELRFDDGAPLHVARLRGMEGGAKPIFDTPIPVERYWHGADGSLYLSSVQNVPAAGKEVLRFLVEIREPGVYLATFSDGSPQRRALKVRSGLSRVWTVSDYFVVGPPSNVDPLPTGDGG